MKADLHRIKNPHYAGEAGELKTIIINEEKGIQALYCVEQRKVAKYLFDAKLWTKDESRDWVADNAKDIKSMETTASITIVDEKMLAVASNEVEDRDGDVISIDGWELANFKKNPVMLWMHNRMFAHDGLPIGEVKNLRIRDIDGRKSLTFTPVFDDTTEFNRNIKKMVEKGLLNMFSVGFIPKERDENKFMKQELLEISLVAVPSNATAGFVQRAKSFGMTEKQAMQVVESKATVEFRAYSPAPESRKWEGSGAINRAKKLAGGPDKNDIDFNQYKESFAWFNSEKKDAFGSYKLAHHDVENGELVTVWKGVVNAMAALLGAGGGVNVPDADKRKIYNHLAKHYKQFDKTPPNFKLVENQELKEVFDIYGEMIEIKTFKEFKKNIRDIKQFMNEAKNEKKTKIDKRSTEIKSKRVATLVLEGLSTEIATLLRDSTSHKKGVKHNE